VEIVFHDKVKADVDVIVAYLAEERPGWENFFAEEYVYLLDTLLHFPKAYRRASSNMPEAYRLAAFQRFKYLIAYFVDEKAEVINVLCVFHSAQHPKNWHVRLKKQQR